MSLKPKHKAMRTVRHAGRAGCEATPGCIRLRRAPHVDPRDPFSRPSGFSLAELLVCCALIAVLALVSVQGLQGLLPAARVNRAMREVVALLEWSRWSAVRSGCVFRVIVNPGEAALTVYRVTKNEPGNKELSMVRRLDLRRDHPGVAFGTAEGVVRTSGCRPVGSSGVHLRDNTIRFLPSGTTDRCGSLYLIPERDIPDRRDRMRAISILLATGRIQTWAYSPFAKSECPNDGAWHPL